MYFLVNVSPPKRLATSNKLGYILRSYSELSCKCISSQILARSNFNVHRSHDVEGTGLLFVQPWPRSRSYNVSSCKCFSSQTVRRSNFKPQICIGHMMYMCIGHMMYRVLDNILCDLYPTVKFKYCTFCKCISLTIKHSNIKLCQCMSHDEEGPGQHLVWPWSKGQILHFLVNT